MKNVLIIAYYWPPAGGPGAQRNVKFVKYLKDYGWNAHVLTVNSGEFPYYDHNLSTEVPSFVNVYRTRSLEPYIIYKRLVNRDINDTIPTALLTMKHKSLKDRLASSIRANLFVPDARLGWIPFAVSKARQIITRYKIDVIYTSSPPHSLQLTGLILKKLYKLPWVVDFRDPWTKIRYYEFIKRNRLAKSADNYFEKKVLKKSDKIVTVSHSLAQEFLRLGDIKDPAKIIVIPNGFDGIDYDSADVLNSRPTLNILYAGNMLSHQNPEVLWGALSSLIKENEAYKKITRVELYGRIHPDINDSIKHHGLQEVVSINGFIPHQEIVKKIQQSSLLVMVVPNIKNNFGIVTGKLFEYIGSGRPILVIGPPKGDAGKIIEEFTNSKIVDYDQYENCRDYLDKIYMQWKNQKQSLSPVDSRDKYSRKSLTHTLTNIFNNISN